MADVFVSYTRADQDIVRRIVALLEAQGWSVWWDTRISGGDRWDEVIEREINAARCVVVVWTPQSIDREWVRLEADHGREHGILVPIMIDVERPPLAFRLIQALQLTGWDGATKTAAVGQFLDAVAKKLGSTLVVAQKLQPPPLPAISENKDIQAGLNDNRSKPRSGRNPSIATTTIVGQRTTIPSRVITFMVVALITATVVGVGAYWPQMTTPREVKPSVGDLERQLKERNLAIEQQKDRMFLARGRSAAMKSKKINLVDELARLKAERPALAAELTETRTELEKRSRAADNIQEDRVRDATNRLTAVDSRISQLERELFAIDGYLAKLKGEEETAQERLRMFFESHKR